MAGKSKFTEGQLEELKQNMKEMYENQKLSVADISKVLKISVRIAYYYMEKFNIKRRSFSESQTDKVKQKIKQTSQKKYGVDHPSQDSLFKDKRKQTCFKKYGFENASSSDEVKNKIKQTCLKKYGVESALSSKEIKEKQKKTILEKYGVENVFQNEQIKEKSRNTCLKKYGTSNAFQNSEIKKKYVATIQAKYGVNNISQIKDVKNKKIETCRHNFGVDNPLQSKVVRKKAEITTLKKYNTKYATQSDQVKNKTKITMNERYGCDYPYQNKDIFDKSVKNSFAFQKYKMPSGREVYIQGYEGLMLDILLENNNESDIFVHKDVPSIKWYNNGKIKFHYPDIYIKSLNKIIEVKSTWTFNMAKQEILDKQKAAVEQGFLYTIFVLQKIRRKIAKAKILYEI